MRPASMRPISLREAPAPYGPHREGLTAPAGDEAARSALTKSALPETAQPESTLLEPGLPESGLPESALTALWLLGRVPAEALPVPVLRPGRAGRGPGPDVREATVLLPSGVTRTGDVEVHLRASDFVRHGHREDPAYAGVILHLCWEDDRGLPVTGGTPAPTALPAGGPHRWAPTVVLAPLLRDPARVEALVARGPTGAEPCAGVAERLGAAEAGALVRDEGRRRLAERAWRAWRLADRYGFDGAFDLLLDRALAATAGRAREDEARRAALAAAVRARLGLDPVAGLERLVTGPRPGDGGTPAPGALIATMQVDSLGRARAAEVAWNAALPLLAALAAAYEDVPLAAATASLASAWPAPRPYGRTRALAALAGPPPPGAGALYAQGLLHLQDLWCGRGGCGACPLSASG